MIDTTQLFSVAETENIIIEHIKLNENIQGAYSSYEAMQLILINSAIVPGSSLYRSVLAEELGHHFTSVGNYAVSTYSGQLFTGKEENRALTWAADFMLDTVRFLQKAVSFQSKNELLDYFKVEPFILDRKLAIMEHQKNYWRVDEKTGINIRDGHIGIVRMFDAEGGI